MRAHCDLSTFLHTKTDAASSLIKWAAIICVIALAMGGFAGSLFGSFQARAAELVSVNDMGTDSGNGRSRSPSISADGTKVAFSSFASDLGPTDTNGTLDVFVRDLTTGTTTLVSVNDFGTDSANNFSLFPVISADGTKVVFISFASDLVPTDTNGQFDVFVRDLIAGTTTLVSVNDLGTDSGNADSIPFFGALPMSADGTILAFRSAASDLVPTDTNGTTDIFVALTTGPVEEPGPADLLASLITDVVDLNLEKGKSDRLSAKLGAAEIVLSDASANNDLAAINALEAFIASVEALRGNALSDAEADALIASAEEIIDLLVT